MKTPLPLPLHLALAPYRYVSAAGLIAAFVVTPIVHATPEIPEPPTEIISGQSRTLSPKTRRSARANDPPLHHYGPQAISSNFLRPLAPLPKAPYYGKIQRPRKHRLDQDRDGIVSKQELDIENQSRSAAFREADHNNDGKLDASELRHFQALVHPRGRGRR